MNKRERFVESSKTLKQAKINVKKGTALINLSLVVIILGLILSLSVMSHYLFFEYLLASSFIILSVSVIKFLNLKNA